MNRSTHNLKSLKVMILAAGEGMRLRPLTEHLPKPLTPVANRPVMEHTLHMLAKQGIKEVMINISYLPEMIQEYFGSGERYGLKIHYSVEDKALGTAGGVKKVEDFFNDTFLIISGDGLVDLDISRLMRQHRSKKALGTMVVHNADMKYEYGVVISSSAGLIKKFIEKPFWSDVFSSKVNTGIYVFEPGIFEYIPRNRFYDFGSQVWLQLLKKKKKIFSYELKDYWCDIGDIGVYRRAQYDALCGRVHVSMPGREIQKGIWVGHDSSIDNRATLLPPCIIGDQCRIGPMSRIGPNTTIGDHARVGSEAVITGSVLWNNVTVSQKSILVDCIVTSQVTVNSNEACMHGAILTPASQRAFSIN